VADRTGVSDCMVGRVSLTLAPVDVVAVGVEGLVEGSDGIAVQAGPDVGVNVGPSAYGPARTPTTTEPLTP
jgi:hypothetical protein